MLVALHNVGLIVIDSVAANFRAEFDRPVNKRLKPTTTTTTTTTGRESGPAQMARRGRDLVALAGTLRALAAKHNLAVVVANQVSDRFERAGRAERMALDFQARWFSGWGEDPSVAEEEQQKVPALGLVWANMLAGRVALRRRNGGGVDGDSQRAARVVFAAWTRGGVECGFEIVEGGVKALVV